VLECVGKISRICSILRSGVWWACRDAPPCFSPASGAGWVGLLLASTSLLRFFTGVGIQKSLAEPNGHKNGFLRSCFSNGGDPPVFARPSFPSLPCRLCPPVLSPFSLLWRRAHPLHQLVYGIKRVKKVKKKYFLTKSRQFCTFMKVGGRCAARPQRTQAFSGEFKSLRILFARDAARA
jgi:hypothetical protein